MYITQFCLLVNTCNVFYNKNLKRKLTSNSAIFKGYSTQAFNLRRNLTLDGVRVDHILLSFCAPRAVTGAAGMASGPQGQLLQCNHRKARGIKCHPYRGPFTHLGILGFSKRWLTSKESISGKMSTNTAEPRHTKPTLKTHYVQKSG